MSNFEKYLLAVYPYHGIWRIPVGFVAITTIWFCGLIGMMLLLRRFLPYISPEFDFTTLDLDPINEAHEVLLLLGCFSFFWLGLWIILRLFHKQKFITLFEFTREQRFRQIVLGFLLVMFALLIFEFILLVQYRSDYSYFAELKPGVVWNKFLLVFPLLFVLTLVQSGAEELIFRGYLLQQLALRFDSWIIWALLPSLFFGLLHYDSDLSLIGRLLYIYSTTIFGLVACVLVWLCGSLWPAIGMHFTNNIYAFSFIGVEDYFEGTQLWTVPKDSLEDGLIVDAMSWTIVLAIITSPIGQRLCRRIASKNSE